MNCTSPTYNFISENRKCISERLSIPLTCACSINLDCWCEDIWRLLANNICHNPGIITYILAKSNFGGCASHPNDIVCVRQNIGSLYFYKRRRIALNRAWRVALVHAHISFVCTIVIFSRPSLQAHCTYVN